jgi:hypothetical protein
MPLIKYFGFVGSALFLSLMGLGWFFSQPQSEPPEPSPRVSDKPTIRIASAEQLPERVIIDTNGDGWNDPECVKHHHLYPPLFAIRATREHRQHVGNALL